MSTSNVSHDCYQAYYKLIPQIVQILIQLPITNEINNEIDYQRVIEMPFYSFTTEPELMRKVALKSYKRIQIDIQKNYDRSLQKSPYIDLHAKQIVEPFELNSYFQQINSKFPSNMFEFHIFHFIPFEYHHYGIDSPDSLHIYHLLLT
jgi:hypothetical protein